MKILYLLLFQFLPFYLFAQTFTGTYTIGGASPNYPTINAAVTALKAGAVIGPVDFSIRPGTYNEQVTLSAIIGTNAVNTVTFRSSTGKPEDVIVTSAKSGNTNHHTWQLNATRYIIIKDLTVANTSSSNASGIHITSDINTTAEFNTVQNCTVLMDAVSTNDNLLGITISGLTINSTGIDNYCNYNIIRGNRVRGGSNGIQIYSSILSYKSDNQIANNLIEDTYHFGIDTRTSINTTVSGNRIRMRKVSDTRNEAFGMYLYYDLNSLYYNNMVEGGFANTTNGAGIYLYYPLNNTRLYFNSVYYESMSPYGRAFAYNGWQDCEIFNNIFYNAGTGYAYYSLNSVYQDLCLSDYNDLYTNGVYLAYWSGNHTTLQSLQATSLKDSNSISVEPGYFGPNDLHTFHPFLDGKGTVKLGVSTDIDGEPREAAPDIGADEFVSWATDVALINLSVSGIPAVKDSNIVQVTMRNEGKNSLKDMEFSVSYSDNEGQTWSPPETVKPSGLTTPYTTEEYTFETPWKITKPGLVTLRVRVNPPGLTGDGHKENDSTFTSVCVGLGGTYTVGGATPDFTTISEAVELLSCGGVSGPVTLNIAPGIYQEKISIGAIQGASDINRIVLRSATGKASDVTVITEGAALNKDHHVIQLNGADYVTLEKLTIINTSTGNYVSGVQLTNGADYNTITGCVIRLDTVQDGNRYRLCIVTSTPTDIFGAGNNANYTLIANNLLQGGSYGMRLCGGSAEHTRGNRVINNKIINAGFIGIRTYLDDLDEVSGNTISLRLSSPIISYGIYLGYVNSDFKLDNNYISNSGFLGIFVDYSAPLNLGRISNNMISGKFSDTTEMARGIYLNNCSFITVAFNSVSVDRENSAAFNLAGASSSDIMVYNNIFHNAANGYAYKIDATEAVTASDYNDFYSDSVLAYWDQDIPTLNDLQTISSMEQNSLAVLPGFFAPDDLHLKNPLLNGKGMYMAAIAADIDGDARNTSAPDIGADEFGLDPLPDATLVEILSPGDNTTVTDAASVSIRIKNSGPVTLTGLIVRYTVDNADTVKETFGTSLLPGIEADHVFNTLFSQLTPGAYDLCAEIAVPNDSNKADNKKCITVQYVKTGTGIHAETAGIARVYPNPAVQTIFLQAERTESGRVHLKLFDLSGKLCFESEADLQPGKTVLAIPVSELPAGVYVLQIQDEYSVDRRKVVIRD